MIHPIFWQSSLSFLWLIFFFLKRSLSSSDSQLCLKLKITWIFFLCDSWSNDFWQKRLFDIRTPRKHLLYCLFGEFSDVGLFVIWCLRSLTWTESDHHEIFPVMLTRWQQRCSRWNMQVWLKPNPLWPDFAAHWCSAELLFGLVCDYLPNVLWLFVPNEPCVN